MTTEDSTGCFPENSNNDLRLELAIKFLANELETNKAYRDKWANGVATSMINELHTNGIKITYVLMRSALEAASAFVDNITHAAKTPLGWVYDNK
jgi:hypothetical protein